MRRWIAFTKKEFLEQLRTSKSLILLAVFFLFGIMSPVLAKITPEILSSMDMQGIQIILPEPTMLDSYAQFFKNLTQMGILVLLLVFGGTLSNELSKGTLIIMLSKGLGRSTVILSKYTAAVALWSISYILAAAVDYGYTLYLFGEAAVENLVFSLFCLWLFGCLVLALIILSSTIAPGSFGGLILTAAAIAMMLILDIIPKTGRYNPITLASDNLALLTGETRISTLMITVIITGVLIALNLIAAIIIFNKKRL